MHLRVMSDVGLISLVKGVLSVVSLLLRINVYMFLCLRFCHDT